MHAFTIWLPVASYYSDNFNPCIPGNVRSMHGDYHRAGGTAQPDWQTVGHVGDVQPLEYGGGFVYADRTGVYPPEVHFWHERENGRGKFKVYRFALEPCFYNCGILSDNRFHKNSPAWFADRLESMTDDTESLIEMFLSSDPMTNVAAWLEVGNYHGFENLDSYPGEYTLAEMETRYKTELEESETKLIEP